MVLSVTSASLSRFFSFSLFSTQTPEQKKDKAEQALKTLFTDFLEAENRQLNAEALFAKNSTIKLLKDCKKYGVDLNNYATNLLIYETTLTENCANISLTDEYRELAQALLKDCDLTEVATSLIGLIGLNAPLERLAQLINQGADKCKVLATLVVAFGKCQRQVAQLTEQLAQQHLDAVEKKILATQLAAASSEEHRHAAQLTELMAQHPLDAVEKINFAAQIKASDLGLDLNEITRTVVRNLQLDLAVQLLSYGASHETIFCARYHELSLEEVIEKIKSLAATEQAEKKTLVDRLRIALSALVDKLAKVQHAAFTKAVLATLTQANATFKNWFDQPQHTASSMTMPDQSLPPPTIFIRDLI